MILWHSLSHLTFGPIYYPSSLSFFSPYIPRVSPPIYTHVTLLHSLFASSFHRAPLHFIFLLFSVPYIVNYPPISFALRLDFPFQLLFVSLLYLSIEIFSDVSTAVDIFLPLIMTSLLFQCVLWYDPSYRFVPLCYLWSIIHSSFVVFHSTILTASTITLSCFRPFVLLRSLHGVCCLLFITFLRILHFLLHNPLGLTLLCLSLFHSFLRWHK